MRYIKIKGLIDAFKMNNYLNEKWDTYVLLSEQTPSEISRIQRDKYLKLLTDYSPLIKYAQQDAYESTDLLITKIDTYLTTPKKKKGIKFYFELKLKQS